MVSQSKSFKDDGPVNNWQDDPCCKLCPTCQEVYFSYLSTLRYMSSAKQQWTTLDQDFKADVTWFLQYAQSGNGLSLLTPRTICFYIECDSSLTGGGGNTNIAYYSWKYSQDHTQKYTAIHQLEAVNLLVAYRTLSPPTGTQGQCIVMVTDNISSAYALSTGRTRDSVLAACARELWLEAARADHDIKIIHRCGELIPLANSNKCLYVLSIPGK